MVFWVVTHSDVVGYYCFGGPCCHCHMGLWLCLHPQGNRHRVSQLCDPRKKSHTHFFSVFLKIDHNLNLV